jgi:hypothetical protein
MRPQTTVPQQGLVAFNAPLVIEAAKQAAARSGRSARNEGVDRLDALWRIVFARSPTMQEQVLARDWLEGQAVEAGSDFGPWPQLAQALMATAEFQYVD